MYQEGFPAVPSYHRRLLSLPSPLVRAALLGMLAASAGACAGEGMPADEASAEGAEVESVEVEPEDAVVEELRGPSAGPGSLTAGWTQKKYSYAIHKPFDLDVSKRYKFDAATNTHTFWILRGDRPHEPPPNTTSPRTELRMKNDYTSGNHQFEADFYVIAGTDGPCVMQVFGGQSHATSFMLKASNDNGGTLRRYDNEVLKTNAYDKWFHLNVVHTAKANGVGQVKVYIDNQHVGTFEDRGPATHYFKAGVYGTSSQRSETRFRNIKYWTK
jgi:hypothetical protein